MSEFYDKKLKCLRDEIEKKGARPLVVDGYIADLMDEGGDNLIKDMLELLSDRAKYDEGMFSIIHALESLDEAPYGSYVSALLLVFPVLSVSSPRWASIVLMRLMNADTSRHELVRQLREAPPSIKESVRSMCDRINEVSPEFLKKTIPVMIAAGY